MGRKAGRRNTVHRRFISEDEWKTLRESNKKSIKRRTRELNEASYNKTTARRDGRTISCSADNSLGTN